MEVPYNSRYPILTCFIKFAPIPDENMVSDNLVMSFIDRQWNAVLLFYKFMFEFLIKNWQN